MTQAAYQVAWTGGARRALTRPPHKVGAAVVELCYGSLAEHPERVGKSLRFDFAGLHSARRGDFRVIFRIDETGRRIDIVAIEHRSDAYRPR